MATSAPKYPYPATLSVGNFVSIKLSQNNYLLWKTQIMGLIESQDMIGFIDGSLPIPKPHIKVSSDEVSDETFETNSDFLAWKKSDRLLRGWITGTLLEEVLGLVVGLDTSAEVWTALSNSFAQESQEREFYLQQSIQMHQKGNYSMPDYIRIFKNLCDDLAAIGKLIDDRMKVFTLLKGLGPGYESFVTTMLKPPIPSYRDLVPLLQGHETMKNIHNPVSVNQPNHNLAFVGQRSTSFGGNQNFHRRGKQYSSNFNSKGRGGFIPKGATQKGTGHEFVSTPKNENFADTVKKNESQVCQICSKTGHMALECWHRFNQTYQPNNVAQALVAISIKDVQDNA